MGEHPDKDVVARKLRLRISSIEDDISRERDFIEYGATYDYEYAMAESKIEALKTEKQLVQTHLQDL